jgi:XTP/dITP diphosphohydrolase
MKIVLATHNKDKCAEMSALLSSFPIEILTLGDFPRIGEITEDGATLEENAYIKARTVHSLTGFPSLADDTGLEVNALSGQPGIYSARYAGENCSYLENVQKLLHEMEHIPHDMRTAHFKTIIAFVGENMELVSEGIIKGMITTKPKGVGGFGYDPVFYVPNKGKTYSEMEITEKNQISHRAKAIQNMTKLLESHFPETFYQMEDIA